MFAGRFIDAAAAYADVLRERPEDPMVLMQAAVAGLYARNPASLANADVLSARAWKACANLPANDRTRGFALNLQAVLLIVRGQRLEEAEAFCIQAREVLESGSSNVSLLAASFSNQAVLYLIESKYLATINLFDECDTVGGRRSASRACWSPAASAIKRRCRSLWRTSRKPTSCWPM